MVPKGAAHHYQILEAFPAVEVTAPAARVRGPDGRLR
jgi:hypothetical protein